MTDAGDSQRTEVNQEPIQYEGISEFIVSFLRLGTQIFTYFHWPSFDRKIISPKPYHVFDQNIKNDSSLKFFTIYKGLITLERNC